MSALDPSLMETVQVPNSVMLEAMLKKLGLPSPKYENTEIGVGYFESKVSFYPSAQFLHGLSHPRSLLSYPEDTLEEAIDQVAAKAIRYMKNEEKKVLEDFSYAQLERQKKVNRALVRHMEAKDLKIQKKNNRNLLKPMITTWLLCPMPPVGLTR